MLIYELFIIEVKNSFCLLIGYEDVLGKGSLFEPQDCLVPLFPDVWVKNLHLLTRLIPYGFDYLAD